MKTISVNLNEWDVKIEEMKELKERTISEMPLQPEMEGYGDVAVMTEDLFKLLKELESSYDMLLDRTIAFLEKTRSEFYLTDVSLAKGISNEINEVKE